MIISDLSHFEVVAETTIILGGNRPSSLLASTMLQGISDQLHSPIQVDNLITSGNQAASATAGSFTAAIPAGEVQGVFSTSLATSPQR